MEHGAKQFAPKLKAAKIIGYEYLRVWFDQIFQLPEYKATFGDDDPSSVMAAQLINHFFGEDIDAAVARVEPAVKEKILLVRPHLPKWADDVMGRDSDFRKFLIQTVRIDMIYNQFLHGTKWLSEDPRGQRVSVILQKYGGGVSESPKLNDYDKLLHQWTLWVKITREKRGTA